MQDDEQVTCFQCLADIWVETSGTVEMTMAARRLPTSELWDGTKAHVCAYLPDASEDHEAGRLSFYHVRKRSDLFEHDQNPSKQG